MYQVVVAEAGQRLKLASFPAKQAAIEHAQAQRPDMTYEVVDDRTALLKAVIKGARTSFITVPTRRDIA